MKYKGKKIEGRNKEIIIIPREGENIVLIAEAVPDWDEFDKIITEPTPPIVLKPGGIKTENVRDPKYIKAMDDYGTQRTHWIILKSLQATTDLEWETVDINKPETWKNYEKELQDSGFSPIEIGRVVRGVMRANSLDDDMIDEAKSDFLAGLEAAEK